MIIQSTIDLEGPDHLEDIIPWLKFFSPGLHFLLLTTLDKEDKPTLLVNMMLSQSEVLVKGDAEISSYVMINESNILLIRRPFPIPHLPIFWSNWLKPN